MGEPCPESGGPAGAFGEGIPGGTALIRSRAVGGLPGSGISSVLYPFSSRPSPRRPSPLWTWPSPRRPSPLWTWPSPCHSSRRRRPFAVVAVAALPRSPLPSLPPLAPAVAVVPRSPCRRRRCCRGFGRSLATPSRRRRPALPPSLSRRRERAVGPATLGESGPPCRPSRVGQERQWIARQPGREPYRLDSGPRPGPAVHRAGAGPSRHRAAHRVRSRLCRPSLVGCPWPGGPLRRKEPPALPGEVPRLDLRCGPCSLPLRSLHAGERCGH